MGPLQFVESHRTQLHITMYKLIVLSVVLVAASAQFAVPAGYGYAGHPIAHAGLPYAHAGLPYPYAAGGAILPHTVPEAKVIGQIAGAPVVPAPAALNYALPAPREIVEAPLVSQTVEKVEQHGYSIRY